MEKGSIARRSSDLPDAIFLTVLLGTLRFLEITSSGIPLLIYSLTFAILSLISPSIASIGFTEVEAVSLVIVSLVCETSKVGLLCISFLIRARYPWSIPKSSGAIAIGLYKSSTGSLSKCARALRYWASICGEEVNGDSIPISLLG